MFVAEKVLLLLVISITDKRHKSYSHLTLSLILDILWYVSLVWSVGNHVFRNLAEISFTHGEVVCFCFPIASQERFSSVWTETPVFSSWHGPAWWRYDRETHSIFLAIYGGNPTVADGLIKRRFDVLFDVICGTHNGVVENLRGYYAHEM